MGFSLSAAQKNVAIIWEIFESPGLPRAWRRILLVRKNIKEIQGSVLAGWPVEPLSGPDRGDLALPETGALITAEKTRD